MGRGRKESLKKTEIDHNIDEIKLKEFEKKLKKLILEIMDPNIPFSSKV